MKIQREGFDYDTKLGCIYFFEFDTAVDCAYYPLVRLMRDNGFKPYPSQPQKFYSSSLGAPGDATRSIRIRELLGYL